MIFARSGVRLRGLRRVHPAVLLLVQNTVGSVLGHGSIIFFGGAKEALAVVFISRPLGLASEVQRSREVWWGMIPVLSF
jgi:hypothetical protein